MEPTSQTRRSSQAKFFDVSHPMYMQLINGHAVRLFELSPGQGNEQVSITLSIHELEHAPPFDAISYVWGDAKQRQNIVCNKKFLSVTQSLDAALRRVRYTDRPRFLWADAICINQGDLREKSHHVAFMCDVYKRAKTVLICMGPDEHGAGDDIVELVQEYAERSAPYPNGLKRMPVLEDNSSIIRDPRWKSLARLLSNTWWSRAWVIQEAGMAQNPVVLFGTAEIDYRLLTRLLRWIVGRASQLQTTASISVTSIHTDWEEWSEGWEDRQDYPYGAVDLLSHAKGLGCQEPRDHIYAFVGHPLLRTNGGGEPVVPTDYTIPTTAVYRRLTEWLIEEVGLYCLAAAEHDEATILDSTTPSWVIRWDMDIIQSSFGYYKPFYYNASALDEAHNIGGESVIRYKQPLEGDILKLSAGLIQTIVSVHQFSAKEQDWTVEEADLALERTACLRDVLQAIRSTVNDPETPCIYSRDAVSDALSLTLASGLRNYETAEKHLEAHREDRDAFWAACERLGHTDTPDDARLLTDESDVGDVDPTVAELKSSERADRFYYDLSLACKGRCFFVTDQGYYGVGPWIIKPGDHVRVVHGLRVPVALRLSSERDISSPGPQTSEAESGSQQYLFLGETYMHGAMRGELVDKAGGVWDEILVV